MFYLINNKDKDLINNKKQYIEKYIKDKKLILTKKLIQNFITSLILLEITLKTTINFNSLFIKVKMLIIY